VSLLSWFLISGHLAMTEICHRFAPAAAARSRLVDLVINQIGSLVFMISALTAFTTAESESEGNVDLADSGTLISVISSPSAV
jgi:hypothetical protein